MSPGPPQGPCYSAVVEIGRAICGLPLLYRINLIILLAHVQNQERRSDYEQPRLAQLPSWQRHHFPSLSGLAFDSTNG